MGLPEKVPKTHLFSGNLHAVQYPERIDLYNPNVPYAQATLKRDGVGTCLRLNPSAPRHFRIEVQEHLVKLKTLLILGGPT